MIPEQLQKIINELKNDLDSGASQLAGKAVLLLAGYAGQLSSFDEYHKAGWRLAEARPSMAAISHALTEFSIFVNKKSGNMKDYRSFCKVVAEAAEEYVRGLKDARSEAARNCLQLFENKNRILTHSYSSTLREVFEICKNKLWVFVTEAQPGREGLRLAKEVAGFGHNVTVITDAAAATVLNEVDMILLGADSILDDGRVVNKAGSSLLAAAAHHRGIPVYIVSEFLKVEILGNAATLEEMPADEIRDVTDGVSVRNTYFDITPAEHITGYIMEDGLKTAAQISAKTTELRKAILK